MHKDHLWNIYMCIWRVKKRFKDWAEKSLKYKLKCKTYAILNVDN